MDPHAQFEQLLADLLDGPADEARNRQLNELLRVHPELQDEYLNLLQLHALLQWRAGQAKPHSEPAAPVAQAKPPRRARWRLGRTLAAAMLLFAIGSAAFVVLQPQDAHAAAADLVDRLIDWNLELAQTRSQDERHRIYDKRAAFLTARLVGAELATEDRELAERLLENSVWLTKNDDPAATADRFNDIADKLVARMDDATKARDDKRIVQLADTCSRLAEHGVDASIQRAIDAGDLNFASEQKLEMVILSDANRTKKLAAMMERNPETPRKAIHRAMKSHHALKMKKHKAAK